MLRMDFEMKNVDDHCFIIQNGINRIEKNNAGDLFLNKKLQITTILILSPKFAIRMRFYFFLS